MLSEVDSRRHAHRGHRRGARARVGVDLAHARVRHVDLGFVRLPERGDGRHRAEKRGRGGDHLASAATEHVLGHLSRRRDATVGIHSSEWLHSAGLHGGLLERHHVQPHVRPQRGPAGHHLGHVQRGRLPDQRRRRRSSGPPNPGRGRGDEAGLHRAAR